MISGYRVRLARELAHLTQADLAADLGITQPAIAGIEAGRIQPAPENLQALARALHFPVAFFEQDDPPHFAAGSLLYRSHGDLAASERAEAEHYGQLVYEMSLAFGKRVRNNAAVRLPRLWDEPTDVVTAAQLTRASLGLSTDQPIPHLIRAVEQAGVLVFTVPYRLEKRDAYSLWSRVHTLWTNSELARPVIVVFGGVSGDRLRFSVAHELGHLILHQSIRGNTKEMEDEANLFAAELLTPAQAMRAELLPPITLAGLLPLKLRWRVSLISLLIRAEEIGVITPRQLKYLRAQRIQYGWKEHEPNELASEKPRLLRQMAEMLYGAPLEYQRIAADLRLPPLFVRSVLEAHDAKEGANISPRAKAHATPVSLLDVDRTNAKPSST